MRHGLTAVLLLCAMLLSVAPAAAAAATDTSTQAALPAPTLFSATINQDATGIALFWTPAAGDTAEFYSVYADDLLVQRLTADPPHLLLRDLRVHDELTGRETYTVVGEDGAGNESPPSNGKVPSEPAPLPGVELRSAVLGGRGDDHHELDTLRNHQGGVRTRPMRDLRRRGGGREQPLDVRHLPPRRSGPVAP